MTSWSYILNDIFVLASVKPEAKEQWESGVVWNLVCYCETDPSLAQWLLFLVHTKTDGERKGKWLYAHLEF